MTAISNKHTVEVTNNGDKIKLYSILYLKPCLTNIKVNLPQIPGAMLSFNGTPEQGIYNGAEWIFGDWCTGKPEKNFLFCYELTIIDITQVEGVYNGLAITSTNQDVNDDSFEIVINKVCPEIGEDPVCEIEEVTEVVYLNPIKPKPKNKKVFFEPIVGQPVQATKITTKKAKVKTNCPTDIKLS